MQREPREVWIKRVERWQDSDLTAKEFASEIGVNHNTLLHWKYRLARDGRAPAPQGPKKPTAPLAPDEPKTAVRFIELPAPNAELNDFRLELPNGAKLSIPTAFDPEALGRLLDVLKDAA